MANMAGATQDVGRQELCLPGVLCLERARVRAPASLEIAR